MPKKQKKLSSTKLFKKPITIGKSSYLTLHKNNKMNWPLIVFIIGALLFSISLLYHLQQLANLTFYHQQLPSKVYHQTELPMEIRIDKVDLDLPIFETVIAHNTWQIADDGISHLQISSRPGENGTIIMYGHNTDDRFGPIRWLTVGDEIEIINKNNKTYTYFIESIVTVDPNNTNILTSQKGETLILYTCTGFADLQRYVVIAKPKK